eukprot:5619406-Prymnesium_polylepis.1
MQDDGDPTPARQMRVALLKTRSCEGSVGPTDVNLPRVDGRLPDSMVLDILKVVRCARSPSCDGTNPEMEAWETSRNCSFWVRAASCDGSVPLSALDESISSSKSASLPIAGGSEPERDFWRHGPAQRRAVQIDDPQLRLVAEPPRDCTRDESVAHAERRQQCHLAQLSGPREKRLSCPSAGGTKPEIDVWSADRVVSIDMLLSEDGTVPESRVLSHSIVYACVSLPISVGIVPETVVWCSSISLSDISLPSSTDSVPDSSVLLNRRSVRLSSLLSERGIVPESRVSETPRDESHVVPSKTASGKVPESGMPSKCSMPSCVNAVSSGEMVPVSSVPRRNKRYSCVKLHRAEGSVPLSDEPPKYR